MCAFKRIHRRACTHSGIHLFIKFMVRGTFYTIIRAARAGGAGVEETEGDGDDECDSVVLCVYVCMCVFARASVCGRERERERESVCVFCVWSFMCRPQRAQARASRERY